MKNLYKYELFDKNMKIIYHIFNHITYIYTIFIISRNDMKLFFISLQIRARIEKYKNTILTLISKDKKIEYYNYINII